MDLRAVIWRFTRWKVNGNIAGDDDVFEVVLKLNLELFFHPRWPRDICALTSI